MLTTSLLPGSYRQAPAQSCQDRSDRGLDATLRCWGCRLERCCSSMRRHSLELIRISIAGAADWIDQNLGSNYCFSMYVSWAPSERNLECFPQDEARLKSRQAPQCKLTSAPEPTDATIMNSNKKSTGSPYSSTAFNSAGFEAWDGK